MYVIQEYVLFFVFQDFKINSV